MSAQLGAIWVPATGLASGRGAEPVSTARVAPKRDS